MRSLRKALNVLEYISSQNGHPVTPSKLSEKCGINLTSCVRMVQTLTEGGYLQQISRRAGYVSGPALVALGAKNSLYRQLVDAAAGPLAELAAEIQALVNISILHHGERYMLSHYGTVEDSVKLFYHYVKPPWSGYWANATERLLLAAAEKKELECALKKHGLPKIYESVEQLEEELSAIRKQGYVKFWSDYRQRWVAGVLIRAEGFPVAAIGYYVFTEEDADHSIEISLRTAEKIAETLSQNAMQFC